MRHKFRVLDPNNWTVETKSKARGLVPYTGFLPFNINLEYVAKAAYLAFILIEDRFSLWLIRDEEGLKQLQQYHTEFMDIQPDIHLFTPHSLRSGDWEVENWEKKGT